ncbi:MAG: glycerate kinase [Elusimicrobia bacterium]|nr:glycerate kinase [Elusimicrobiota bacterium]
MPLKIVLALSAFKTSLSAVDACRAAEIGLRQRLPEAKIIHLPMSDGGDGLLDALEAHLSTQKINLKVTDALGTPAETEYLLTNLDSKKTAFIETAKICGLAQVPPMRRNPMLTTSYGVGEAIRHAATQNVKMIYVGLGGTATQDGGSGLAQAIGAKLLDQYGKPIGFGCAWLAALHKIVTAKIDSRIKKISFYALNDVTNPLLGPKGTAHIFAPQKGASPEQVKAIEANLKRLASTAARDLKIDMAKITGGGAAGGLGAGLAAFCQAVMMPGAQTVLDIIGAGKIIEAADFVFVGEGSLDYQTLFGKAPQAICGLARRLNKKTLGIFGQISLDKTNITKNLGLTGWKSLEELAPDKETAVRNASSYMIQAASVLADDIIK